MNMQAILNQANKMKNDMMKEKEKINKIKDKDIIM